MDKVIKVALGIFIVILVGFVAPFAFTAYTETAYRNSITGTYRYVCTITVDAPVYNVTLFIPVPVDEKGNSPMASEFSSHIMKGVPGDWETTLFDTGKSTLLRVRTPAIIPPAGTSAQNPSTITFSSEIPSRTPVDTRDPAGKSAMYRPVQALAARECPREISAGAGARCASFATSLYADYSDSPDTRVTIRESVSGRNDWTILEPRSNEYHADVSTVMNGSQKGWMTMDGILSSGAGSYDIPGGV